MHAPSALSHQLQGHLRVRLDGSLSPIMLVLALRTLCVCLIPLCATLLYQIGSCNDAQELAEEFGRHRAREFNVGVERLDTGVRFEDVAGIDDVKADIEEVMKMILGDDEYRAMGARPPRVGFALQHSSNDFIVSLRLFARASELRSLAELVPTFGCASWRRRLPVNGMPDKASSTAQGATGVVRVLALIAGDLAGRPARNGEDLPGQGDGGLLRRGVLLGQWL